MTGSDWIVASRLRCDTAFEAINKTKYLWCTLTYMIAMWRTLQGAETRVSIVKLVKDAIGADDIPEPLKELLTNISHGRNAYVV